MIPLIISTSSAPFLVEKVCLVDIPETAVELNERWTHPYPRVGLVDDCPKNFFNILSKCWAQDGMYTLLVQFHARTRLGKVMNNFEESCIGNRDSGSGSQMVSCPEFAIAIKVCRAYHDARSLKTAFGGAVMYLDGVVHCCSRRRRDCSEASRPNSGRRGMSEDTCL